MVENDFWESPVDESPFDLTNHDWHGGSVEAIGGGGTARIWRHTREPVEVIYEERSSKVDMYHLTENFDVEDTLASNSVDEPSDSALSHAARTLIEEFDGI